MIEVPFIWKAKHIKTVDGDTIDVSIDVGFHATRYERLRLFGINCPEMKGATHAEGQKSKDFTDKWLTDNSKPDLEWPFVIQTFKSDVFGRYLSKIWTAQDYTNFGIVGTTDLSTQLLTLGLAVPFKG